MKIIKQLQEDKEIAILSQNDEQYVTMLCRIITQFDGDPKNPLKSIVALIHEGQRQCQAVAQEGEELIGLLHDETDAALQQIRQKSYATSLTISRIQNIYKTSRLFPLSHRPLR